MSSDWLSTTVEEIAANEPSAISIGPFGSRMKSECYVESGVPVVMGSNISDGKHPAGDFVFVTEAKAAELKSSEVREGDLVFPHRGAIGRVALIPPSTRMILSSSLMKLTPNQEKCCSDFLLYFFRSNRGVHELLKNASTVGTPGIGQPLSSLKRIPLEVPPLGEQKAIAHILGTLDEKIELNRKTNETLEAMAKALFKSWFVDFDSVRAKAEGRPTGLPDEISDLFPDSVEDSELGEIPSGWDVAEIAHIVTLRKDSIDPSLTPEETFDHYSIPAFDTGKNPAKELGSSIKSQKFLVGEDDLLVSKLNPSTPRVWIPFSSSVRRSICSTEFLVCQATPDVGRAFTYCLASSDSITEVMTGLAGGTSNSHQRIRPGDFLALNCCIGSQKVRSAFSDVVEPLLRKTLAQRIESRSLASARDALLPKLISGEIRIPDAERMLEEVGV